MAYTTVVTGTAITASWGNSDVRDQVIVPFASAAARSSAITSPVTGQLSYRSDGPFFEGYDGTGWVSLPYTQVAMTSSDQTVTSSTTLTNITGLSATVRASSKYIVQAWIPYDGATGGDFKFGWTTPASATFVHSAVSLPSTAASIDGTAYMGVINSSGTAVGGGVGAATKVNFNVDGALVTAGTAGTFQLQFAQSSSSGTATTVFAGAWLMVTRVS